MPPTTATTFRRINRGSGHSYEDDRGPLTGVTTALGTALAKPALTKWAARLSAEYVVDHWDELQDMTPTARMAAVAGAHAVRNRSALKRGSEIHKHGEQLARTGETEELPPELVGPIRSYATWLDRHRVQPLVVEAPVVNRRWRYAGTLDLIAVVDAEPWLLDLKTAALPWKGQPYPESVLQLTAYRNAEAMLKDGEEVPLPPIERVGVLYVQPDECVLVEVHPDEDAFRAFTCALGIHRWVKGLEK